MYRFGFLNHTSVSTAFGPYTTAPSFVEELSRFLFQSIDRAGGGVYRDGSPWGGIIRSKW